MADRLTVEAEARLAAELLGRLANRMDENHIPIFVSALAQEHRTLQQTTTRLMLEWFKHLSNLKEYEYDLRNEHSVKVARMIRERLESEWGSAWAHTPLI